MSEFTSWNVTEAMIIYGGSFVKGLGELYRRADQANKAKLRQAFPDYFEKYQAIALEVLERKSASQERG